MKKQRSLRRVHSNSETTEGFFTRHAATIRLFIMIGSAIGFGVGILVAVPHIPITFGGSLIAGGVGGAVIGAALGFVIAFTICAVKDLVKGLIDKYKKSADKKSDEYSGSSTEYVFRKTPPSPASTRRSSLEITDEKIEDKLTKEQTPPSPKNDSKIDHKDGHSRRPKKIGRSS